MDSADVLIFWSHNIVHLVSAAERNCMAAARCGYHVARLQV
jgi:hypothetical protein